MNKCVWASPGSHVQNEQPCGNDISLETGVIACWCLNDKQCAFCSVSADIYCCTESPVFPQYLAMVFQDLLTTKDDYLRASRALLREIIKQTKHEINFQAFCLGLMQERKEAQYAEMEFKVALCLIHVLLGGTSTVLGISVSVSFVCLFSLTDISFSLVTWVTQYLCFAIRSRSSIFHFQTVMTCSFYDETLFQKMAVTWFTFVFRSGLSST